MKVITVKVGGMDVNCYLAVCDKTKEAAIIDPGDEGVKIIDRVKKEGLTVKYIIDTHGHADHIAANGAVKAVFDAPLLIHAADEPMLASPKKNLSMFFMEPVISPAANQLLREGDVIEIGEERLTVLHTPGHTPGGISLAGGGLVFCGDTLFAGSIGRTDFPGGSFEQLIGGIKDKILTMPDDVKVYPGHGPATSVGWERQHNPFLNGR